MNSNIEKLASDQIKMNGNDLASNMTKRELIATHLIEAFIKRGDNKELATKNGVKTADLLLVELSKINE